MTRWVLLALDPRDPDTSEFEGFVRDLGATVLEGSLPHLKMVSCPAGCPDVVERMGKMSNWIGESQKERFGGRDPS